MKALIKNKAQVNAQNEHGNTPLHYACFNNHINGNLFLNIFIRILLIKRIVEVKKRCTKIITKI